MIHKENPNHSRFCPGKDLSFQMMVNFLKAFLKRKNCFHVPDGTEIKISAEINARAQALEISEWEFVTEESNLPTNEKDVLDMKDSANARQVSNRKLF